MMFGTGSFDALSDKPVGAGHTAAGSEPSTAPFAVGRQRAGRRRDRRPRDVHWRRTASCERERRHVPLARGCGRVWAGSSEASADLDDVDVDGACALFVARSRPSSRSMRLV